MTEVEWLTSNDPYPRQLLVIKDYASIRQLRLIAAAIVRRLQPRPENAKAKVCDDVIEAIADHPRPWPELEEELYARPGNWRFTHILAPDADRAVREMRKLVYFNPLEPDHYVAGLIRDVVGNPFRPVTCDPAWRTSTVLALAQGIYDEKAFDRMPILADALQGAGCDNADVLGHCRGNGPHVRGSWVVDLVLGKE